ncbi:MAG TPA: hypothetical protein VEJ88_07460, partial [Dissulfurispiraceae bacterium]|nr:hypothetical protein [Dissulfurispiraceae bacterium]
MYKFFTAEIIGNTSLNTCFKLLTLQPLSEIRIPQPGQFYMIQTGTACDPLLKRPFSIYSIQENRLSFLYRIRGKGTSSLSQLREGDRLQVIGPLGNSYPEPDGDFIAVAGGIGIASLFAFMSKYRRQAYLFYGAQNKDELVMLDAARELSKETFLSTCDGSDGCKGLITDELRDFLNRVIPARRPAQVYACGPVPML